MSPISGPSPYSTHMAHIAELGVQLEFYEKVYLYLLSTIFKASEWFSAISSGMPPPCSPPSAIEVSIVKLATKMELGATVSEPHAGNLEGLRKIFEEYEQGKRGSSSELAPPGQRQKTAPASGSPNSQASGGGAGSPGGGGAKVIEHCWEFQRPGGCSRQGCQKDHVMVRCPYHPNCSLSIEKCKFHHQ